MFCVFSSPRICSPLENVCSLLSFLSLSSSLSLFLAASNRLLNWPLFSVSLISVMRAFSSRVCSCFFQEGLLSLLPPQQARRSDRVR